MTENNDIHIAYVVFNDIKSPKHEYTWIQASSAIP